MQIDSSNITQLAALTISTSNTDTPKLIVSIQPDGHVELGEGANVDDAARAFWDAVKLNNPYVGGR